MSQPLAPMISSLLRELPTLIERTLKHEAACPALLAQCNELAAHIEATKARIAKEKAAQRLLRAEIAAFLRERGELRSANSSRAMEDSLLSANVSVSVAETDSIFSPNKSEYDSSFDMQESPLSLKSKRKGRIFSDQVQVATKRRRLTVSTAVPSSSLA